MKCHHYCNNELTCPTCIRRFWAWAEHWTRGYVKVKGGKPSSKANFYEAASKFRSEP